MWGRASVRPVGSPSPPAAWAPPSCSLPWLGPFLDDVHHLDRVQPNVDKAPQHEVALVRAALCVDKDEDRLFRKLGNILDSGTKPRKQGRARG